MRAFDYILYHAKVIGPFDKLWLLASKREARKGNTVLDTLKKASVEYTYRSKRRSK